MKVEIDAAAADAFSLVAARAYGLELRRCWRRQWYCSRDVRNRRRVRHSLQDGDDELS